MTDAAELYRAVMVSGRLPALRRLTYRCHARRCLLLDAVETPLGVVCHQIRFKQSDGVNEARSSATGRAKNTFDGNNHWRPRTYYVDVSALAWPQTTGSRLSVQCDHVGVLSDGSPVVVTAQEFEEHWQAGHTEIRMRADGSRYAVD